MRKHTATSKISKKKSIKDKTKNKVDKEKTKLKKKTTKKIVDSQLRAVVGIGASAGGLDAVALFLKHLPANTGMAYVYVQHLDPLHASMLTTILARTSRIPVVEAVQGVSVVANTFYVIPPNKSMLIANGCLRLATRIGGSKGLASIDNFFCSLADDQKERSIGVILSGNASDGTIGFRALKKAGGITFAQEERSAKYPSMPHSAIEGGDTDYILPPEGIAKKLSEKAFVSDFSLPGHAQFLTLFDSAKEKKAFNEILAILTSSHKVNFTQYKPMTLKRRISRRMMLSNVESLSEYATYLQKNPSEANELFQDTLIHVTKFFRDVEIFQYLQAKIFPKLVENYTKGEQIRIWVAGCSTGEEAYSFAIAFAEYLGSKKLRIPVQIFGTDLSEDCIVKARRGMYPMSIQSDVSNARLKRFFSEVDGQYQVSKTIRDMCVFAKQNVLSDPSFSRIDIVSCRNVLIYLDLSTQKRIIPMFHYALRPKGYLLLGKSEGIREFSNMFEVHSKTHKLFTKKHIAKLTPFDGHIFGGGKREQNQPRPISKDTRINPQLPVSEIDQALLSSSAIPACVVIDASLEILQFRGDLSPYLNLPSGKATWNLLRIVKQDLMIELRNAVTEAKKENHTVFASDITAGEGRARAVIEIEVIPLRSMGTTFTERHLLVLFRKQKIVEVLTNETVGQAKNLNTKTETQSLLLEKARLQKQLTIVKDQLHSVLEEQEATNEEFQSASEEIMSSNEELQSINEEMETTKEELQSTNEELITMNEEMQLHNSELGVANADLQNVLSSSNVPIIIVDKQLIIRRVTSIAKKSLRIIDSDVGRPIDDIKLPIKFPDLRKILLEVINTNEPKSEEIIDERGSWHMLWVRPYLTLDGKIDGAIIMLVDINEMKLAQITQEQSLVYVEGILGTMREPLVVLDEKLQIKSINKAFCSTFNIYPDKIKGVSFYDLGNKEWDTPQMRELLEKVLPKKNSLENFEIECNFPNTGSLTMAINAHRLMGKDAEEELILLVMENITERKFRQQRTDTFMSMASHELKTPATTIKMLVQIMQKLLKSSNDHELVKYLEKVNEQVNHLTKIANDLLDVSGIKAGKFVLNEESFILSVLVRDVVENCQLLSSTHTIIFHGEDTTQVKGDRERLGRVLINLITNAIKYSPKANKVIVKLVHTKTDVTVSVQDFGIGIAKENRNKIFDHSTQIENEKGQHSTGLGLGLYISSSIIQRHGGSISIKSTKGRGSTFSFTLQCAPKHARLR